MKLTLTIEGSALTLASILAALPTETAAAAVLTPPVGNQLTTFPTVTLSADEDEDDGAVNLNAPLVDTTGLPWDERIHSKGKTTTNAGAWRGKKGVDKAFVAAVENELRGLIVMPTQPVSIPVMPVMPTQPVEQPAPVMAPVAASAPLAQPMPMAMPVEQPPAPLAQPMPMAMPVAAPATAAGVMDFNSFMVHIGGKMQQRNEAGLPMIDADYLAKLAAEISAAFNAPVPAITDIATDPAKISYAVQALQRDGRW